MFASLIVLFVMAGFFAILIAAISPTKSDGAALSGYSAQMRAASRQVYSPTIANDPYVIDQWEKSIQALERACRDSGEYCEQAQQARRSINR
ncbi:hypothetical protein FG91_02531 [Sphingopyxis sp. LC81]|uniref:hypothetical protein n=1 Tax=Sphingopyxis sp. LC81 TaxID=1502850 RepID=UPI00050F06E9|nr:hypothetical protein [Sphingopyxis sp. LC81]KGB54280.1 hypothetical protein FG91_02531 [Sphingopyxis sp. LC81]